MARGEPFVVVAMARPFIFMLIRKSRNDAVNMMILKCRPFTVHIFHTKRTILLQEVYLAEIFFQKGLIMERQIALLRSQMPTNPIQIFCIIYY